MFQWCSVKASTVLHKVNKERWIMNFKNKNIPPEKLKEILYCKKHGESDTCKF